MPLLNRLDYPAIRAALDVSLDELSLPDDTIELDIYLGHAERYVASKTESEGLPAKAAVVYYTAALLAPVIPNITGERDSMGSSYQRQAVDWKAREAQLRARAEEQLDIANEVNQVTGDRPTMFAVACGRRGW